MGHLSQCHSYLGTVICSCGQTDCFLTIGVSEFISISPVFSNMESVCVCVCVGGGGEAH